MHESQQRQNFSVDDDGISGQDTARNSSHEQTVVLTKVTPEVCQLTTPARPYDLTATISISPVVESGAETIKPTRLQDRYTQSGPEVELGRGGQGRVVLVWDTHLNEPAALKILARGSTADSQQAMHKIVREIRISAKLAPADFVTTYDLVEIPGEGTSDSEIGFVMKLVQGCRSLEGLIADYEDAFSSPKPDNAARVRFQDYLKNFLVDRSETSLCTKTDALNALLRALCRIGENIGRMHKLGYMHRDIKPANILIDTFGKIWIADAGLAQSLTENEKSVGVMGSLGFLPPEQATTGLLHGPYSDQYALAATISRVVSGRLQVSLEGAVNRLQLISQISKGEVFRASGKEGGLRGGAPLGAIIRKGMAFDPADRYPTILDLVADLRAFLDKRSVKAYIETASFVPRVVHQSLAWIRENTGMFLSGVALAASSVMGFTGLTLSNAARERALLEEKRASGLMDDPDRANWTKGESILHQAGAEVAPFFWDPWSRGVSNRIRHKLEQSNARSKLYEEFVDPACTALVGSSADFATYRTKSDLSRAVRDVLSVSWPDHYTPDSISSFSQWLKSQNISESDKKLVCELTLQLLHHAALQLPYNEVLGHRKTEDAVLMECLLDNAADLREQFLIPDTNRLAELYLRCRIATTTGNKAQLEMLRFQLEEALPKSYLDWYMHSKFAMVRENNFSKAGELLAVGVAEIYGNSKALQADQRWTEAYLERTRCYGLSYMLAATLAKSGDYTRAAAAAARCLEIAEELPQSLQGKCKAECHRLMGSLLTREASMSNEKISPRRAEIIRNEYRMAVEADPANPLCFVNWASFEYSFEDYQRAIELYTDAIELDPSYAELYPRRAVTHVVLGSWDAALQDAHTACQLLTAAQSVPIRIDSRERIVFSIEDLVEQDDNFLASADLQTLGNIGKALDRCLSMPNITEAEEESLLRAVETILKRLCDRVEANGGYGQDVTNPSTRQDYVNFSQLRPEVFAALMERYKALPPQISPYQAYQ